MGGWLWFKVRLFIHICIMNIIIHEPEFKVEFDNVGLAYIVCKLHSRKFFLPESVSGSTFDGKL